MPAINVARTDTFEAQRVKINQIGQQIFNVTSGGSDLAAGNIKLGDGTQTAPSLAFDTDNTLGFYKPTTSTIGYVATGKKLLDITSENVLFYKDLIVRQEKISSSGITFNSFGSNYDAGTYDDILLTGGSGGGATASFSVTQYGGTLVAGAGYVEGTYTAVELETISGSGSGAIVDFSVPGITGAVTNPGAAYAPGTYSSVPLTGGNGSGAEADITIIGNSSLNGSITQAGSGYPDGNYTNINTIPVTPAQTFVVTANGTSNYIIDGTPSAAIQMTKANTYRFDVSDSSNASHILDFRQTGGGFLDGEYVAISYGSPGTAGAFVDFVITDVAATGTFEYYCVNHPSMTGVFDVVTGAPGQWGKYAGVDITVASGAVTAVTFATSGLGYKATDVITIDPNAFGAGTGFEYTISGITYTGTVDTVTITDSGIGYQENDILSANDADLGGGGGSNFAFTVSNTPNIPTGFTFTDKGTGYTTGDQMGLPTGVTGLTTNLKSTITNVTTTLSNTVATITVASTTGIVAGMEVTQTSTPPGELAPDTTVQSVDSATQITLSDIPVQAGAATIEFRSPGITEEITVSSTAGILAGSIVTQTAGTGTIAAGTTVFSVVDATTLILSATPTLVGTATLNFAPPFGLGTTPLRYTVGDLGVVEEMTLSEGGVGYSVGDIISVDPTDLVQPVDIAVTVASLQTLSFAASTVNAGVFTVGNSVKERDGQVDSINPTTSTTVAAAANGTYTGVSASGGNGSGLTIDISRDGVGALSNFVLNERGYYYQTGDTVTIAGADVGGSTPADNITFSVDTVTSATELVIYAVNESGGYTTSIQCDSSGITDGVIIIPATGTPTQYTVDTVSGIQYRYLFDGVLTPDLTIYSGNTYKFDTSDTSNASYSLTFSKFPGGNQAPSLVENVTTTLSSSSAQITVASTAGIVADMSVEEISSTGGALRPGTTVVSVDSATQVTLSQVALTAGPIILRFSGSSYTDGVTFGTEDVTLKVSDNTPNLYYYDGQGELDLGGADNSEGLLTVNTNNPKVFGSGFNFTVAVLATTDVISNDIETGEFFAQSVRADAASIQNVTVTQALTTVSATATSLAVSSITSSNLQTDAISLTATNFAITSNVNIGSFTFEHTTGNSSTPGEVKTTGSFNSNDALFINNAVISSATSTDIELTPAATRVAKINGTSALTIPSGPTSDRPTVGVVSDGSIRFNTTTNQYEGYSSSTTTWSSLGGVRDLDGNTYILAEETVGANDNTLWFINDGINTLKFTPSYQEFRSVKKVRSANVLAPTFVDWTANTPVLTGVYLKWKNYLYEVTVAGTTGTSGTEPTHTSGAVNNGSAELTFWGSAVGPLTFEDIDELKIGPTSPTDLVINSDLRLKDNIVSTDVSDLVLRPNLGKKVKIDALTSIVVPAGGTTDRGIAEIGAIRYNTTDTQFEGYNGNDWTSLGGVRDVDGNTYIIPETAPGSNENILYFYNDGNNSVQLTTTALDFYTVDTLRSVSTDEFEITASLLTIDQAATTLDNTATDRTFLHTSKQYFDLGLSGGLYVDPVLRLDNQGDVYFNTTFGTGTFNGVKVFDGELKEFELADVRILTEKVFLVKGSIDNTSSDIYSVATEVGAKVVAVAENASTGEKEFIEFGVIDDGTDVHHTVYGNSRTGQQLILPTFSLSGSGVVILNFASGPNISTTQQVNITVTSTITKK